MKKANCSLPDDYGAQFYVAMKGEEYVAGDKHEACKGVSVTLPRAHGRHMDEWFTMMKDGTPRFLQLRHRRLPDRDYSVGLHRVARRRGSADGMGWAEHEIAPTLPMRPSSSNATTAPAGKSNPTKIIQKSAPLKKEGRFFIYYSTSEPLRYWAY